MGNMILGLQVTLFGMGATFLTLCVLAVLLVLSKHIFAPKSTNVVSTAPVSAPTTVSAPIQPAKTPAHSNDDLDVIVVIAAAVAAVMTNERGEAVHHRITSITPLAGTSGADSLALASAK